MVFDAFQKKRGGKGLGDIIDRAQARAFQFAAFVRPGGDEDRRDVGKAPVGAQAAHGLVAVHFRHFDVSSRSMSGSMCSSAAKSLSAEGRG